MSTPCVSFLSVGDVFIDRNNPRDALRHYESLIRAADISFCNLEGPCSDLGTPTIGKLITIRMKPEVIEALAEVQFNVAAFANNHALDYGHDAFLDTQQRLAAHNVACIGGGHNLIEAHRAIILERKGIRIACLAYAATLPWGYEATKNRPGIAPVHVRTHYEPWYQIMSEQPGMPAKVVNTINSDDLLSLKLDVRRAKESAQAVVVSFHWGVAYQPDPAPYQPELAYSAIDAGADLIIGHHTHILQGVEIYKGTPIFYGLSNFVFDFDEPRFGKETMLVAAYFGSDGLERIAIHPAIIPPRREPRPLAPEERTSFLAHLRALSADMKSKFSWDGDEIEIEL